MSIASQCPDCCACPVPVLDFGPHVDVSFVSHTAISASLCGFVPFLEEDEGQCTRYRKKSVEGEFFDPVTDPENPCEYIRRYVFSGEVAYGEGSCSISTYAQFNAWKQDPPDCETVQTSFDVAVSQIDGPTVSVTYGPCEPGSQTSGTFLSSTELSIVGCNFTGSGSETLFEEDTLAAAILRSPGVSTGTSSCANTGERSGCDFGSSTSVIQTIAVSGLPDTTYTITIFYSNYSGTPPVLGAETSETIEVETDAEGVAEFDLEIPQPDPGESRCFSRVETDNYRWIFKPTKIGNGTCYRITWIEREVSEGGVGIDSFSLLYAGSYRPAVSIVTPSGAVEAIACPIMAVDGSVAGIRLLNPGGPYPEAPAVIFETAVNGGVTAEGTASINADGQVVGFAVTEPGDYLPEVVFSPSVASPAVASVTMDPQGGIASISLSDSGANYDSVGVGLLEKCTVTTPAIIIPHYGTEIEKCAVWNGETPEGYDPDDSTTWPAIPPATDDNPFFVLPEGASVGEFSSHCDCVACEEP